MKRILLLNFVFIATLLFGVMAQRTVSGKITDDTGDPLPGVNVVIKGTTTGIQTDLDGNYRLSVDDGATLVFSYVGFETQEVEVGSRTTIDISMGGAVELSEVVVTGYSIIDKESFTGTATTVAGTELIKQGGDNLLSNLTLIAPSVQLIENNSLGSNPNTLPRIRVRGESVFNTSNGDDISSANLLGDPNLPLFILDNFQTTIDRVIDLDQTRIESITILRDASATAIYGSRAANGVIVIKTIRPKEGDLNLTYSGFADVNIVDLNSYDLLNARDLWELQFNRLGLFSDEGFNRHETLFINELVSNGVDTDWLAQPVEDAVGHRHTLNIQGGSSNLRYSANFNFTNRPAVMKESFRDSYGGAVTLDYNASDKLVFRNRLEVNFGESAESPYGNFSYYAALPSYLPINNLDGTQTAYYNYSEGAPGPDLEPEMRRFSPGDNNFLYNPIFESQVGNFNRSNYTNLINNFEAIYNISDALRLQGNISYTEQTNENEVFQSPFSYLFETVEETNRGRFTYINTKTRTFDGNAILNFSKDFSGHFVSANVGTNIRTINSQRYGFTAAGYASNNPNPLFSNGYEQGGIPQSAQEEARLVGFLGTLNYTYKNRFFVDGSYRQDGSSTVGANDRFTPFWSLGAGWNVHREKGFPTDIVNQLRIRATTGQTGSTTFSAFQAVSSVRYFTDFRYLGGLGTFSLGFGNEDLTWQNTNQRELGVELGLFNRVSASLSYYDNLTENLIQEVSTPPSVGFSSFTENLGELRNEGFEISLRGDIIKNKDLLVNVFATGFQNKNTIESIGNSLDFFNDNADNLGFTDEQFRQVQETGAFTDENGDLVVVDVASESNGFLTRFQEGGSQNDIWAVRSLGIDPATGQELFIKRNGKITTIWDPTDKVVVGNTDPDLRGTFGTNIGYKGLNLNLVFRYELGGQVYNQTLVDRIENSDKYLNVDRRVLLDTWMQPGDVVQLSNNVVRSPLGGVRQTSTFASSRFVQDFSFIQLSSVNLTYDIPKTFSERFGANSLRATFAMNDIFYSSSVRRERGTAFPFSRSFTVGLRANF
ncbi:MAG: SusC/RagA family TonB-linked outer membrane protein [Ekhidna sp.]|nr:SusC/RagA family TonB-linked outer membrane protein [Ekhidna sp.]